MSQLRQTAQIDEKSLLVRTLGLKLPGGHVIEGHSHSWGQVIFASRGVMQVDALGSRWIVPPMRCLWMPTDIGHTIGIIAETWLRTIYFRPDLAIRIEADCGVLNVSPLLRELIMETIRRRMLSESVSTDVNLTKVLIDQLTAADQMTIKITMPSDPRALRLANIISADPANRTPLGELSKETGASPRTLERIFVRDTGLSVGRWRHQMRLMLSVRLLLEGSTVSQTAFASGFESPSAFVAMFRRQTGFTPGRYVQNLKMSANDNVS